MWTEHVAPGLPAAPHGAGDSFAAAPKSHVTVYSSSQVRRQAARRAIITGVVGLVVVGVLGAAVWLIASDSVSSVGWTEVSAWYGKRGWRCGSRSSLLTRDEAVKAVRASKGLTSANRSTVVDAIEEQSIGARIWNVTCGDASASKDRRGDAAAVIFGASERDEEDQALVAVVGAGYSHRSELEATGLTVLVDEQAFSSGSVTDSATSRACKIERRTIRTAVAAYRVTTGHLPADLSVLAAPGPTKYLEKAPNPADWAYDPTTGAVTPRVGGSFTSAVVADCGA